MRLVLVMLATGVLVALTSGCGGGSSTVSPDQNQPAYQQPASPGPALVPPATQPVNEDPVASSQTDSAVVEVLRNTNWHAFGMPSMEPSEIREDDKKLPMVIITGLLQGEVVSREVYLSIFASDDLGVNLMALIVDGIALEVVEDFALQYYWDSREWDDGQHEIGVLVRDQGNNFAYTMLSVTSDNTTDIHGPDIEIASVTSTVNGETIEMGTGRLTGFDLTSLTASGLIQITFVASDANELKYFGVGGVRSRKGSEWELLAESTGNTLMLILYTDANFKHYTNYKIRAEDILGHVSETWISVNPRNSVQVSGTVTDGEDQPVTGADVYTMPEDWKIEDGNLEALKTYFSKSNLKGRFSTKVPFGNSQLFIRNGENIRLTPVYAQFQAKYYYIKLTPEQTRLE